MNLIVNTDKNWGIGKDGKLLFPIKEDMQFFTRTTTGNVVIMGRATLDSFPGGKALKNRDNIVLTRNTDFERENVIVCHSLDNLIETIKKYPSEKLYVIGGEQIYNMLLPYCDTAYVTRVDATKDADSHFPDLSSCEDWYIAEQSETMTNGEVEYKFCVYKRS